MLRPVLLLLGLLCPTLTNAQEQATMEPVVACEKAEALPKVFDLAASGQLGHSLNETKEIIREKTGCNLIWDDFSVPQDIYFVLARQVFRRNDTAVLLSVWIAYNLPNSSTLYYVRSHVLSGFAI